jgi:Asp-tRNA(Asn)/Glu-tRNA(Gln) amidotransferase A subunit family amidase
MARSVEECAAMLEVLVPEFRPAADPAPLEEVRVAVAWTQDAKPLVRARVEEVAAHFPRAEHLDFPRPEVVDRLFMHEVADVHRGLFPEHADSYGDDVREKLGQCFAVTDGEAEAAARERERYRERCLDLLDGFDLLLTPTQSMVAPPVGVVGNERRGEITRFTFAFNALGWPALALPCGPAEEGLPASAQLVGRTGEDALVLAVGASLERGTPGPS